MYHFRLRLGLVLVAALFCAAAPEAGLAQPSEEEAPGIDLATVKADLESGDQRRMLRALETVAAAGEQGRTATPYVEALLRRGASTLATVRAIAVAGGLAQQSSSAAIAPYIRHRFGVLREAAARALVSTKGPAAVTALRQGLRSSDPLVRSLSATGLGELAAHQAVGDLFAALDHQVHEAAVAIGRVCTPGDCDRLADKLGKQPLKVILEGLDQVLFRPAEQIPDATKISIINKLRALGTMEVGNYMVTAAQRWPKDGSKPVHVAIRTAAKALGGRVEGR